jgi:hypothetical protein
MGMLQVVDRIAIIRLKVSAGVLPKEAPVSCGFSGWCIRAPRPVESGSPFRSKIPRHSSVAPAS